MVNQNALKRRLRMHTKPSIQFRSRGALRIRALSAPGSELGCLDLSMTEKEQLEGLMVVEELGETLI